MTTTTQAGGCPRCTQLPDIPGSGWSLYLWPPLGHTHRKLMRALDDQDVPRASGADGHAIVLAMDDLSAAGGVAALIGAVSEREAQGTAVLPVAPGATPAFADYPRVVSLFRLNRLIESEPIARVLEDGNIAVSFVPIAAADDPDDVIAHHAHVSFPTMTAPPEQVFRLGEDADLLFQLDRACRVACIRAAAAQGLTTPVFAAFHPASIYDPEFCLRTTVQEVERVGLDPRDVIFTLKRASGERDPAHLQRILSYYRQRDFGVALGELGTGQGTLDLVKNLRPDYLLLGPEITANVSDDPYRAVIARKMLEMVHRLSIGTVALGGLGSNDREWLYEHGISGLARPDQASGSTVPDGVALPAAADAGS